MWHVCHYPGSPVSVINRTHNKLYNFTLISLSVTCGRSVITQVLQFQSSIELTTNDITEIKVTLSNN